MVEYWYDAVRLDKNSNAHIYAYITDAYDNLITTDCKIIIYDESSCELLLNKNGTYDEVQGAWDFELTTDELKNLNGKYWYQISGPEGDLDFKQPLYVE